MSSHTTQELLEASLQLNLRLAGLIGILFSCEDREQKQLEVADFITKAIEASDITTERYHEMLRPVTDGPVEPITAGLL